MSAFSVLAHLDLLFRSIKPKKLLKLPKLTLFCSFDLLQESKLSTVCEKVFDRCLAPTSGGEGCDNMTMILVQFKKRPRSVPSTSGHSSPDQPSESSGSKDKPEST